MSRQCWPRSGHDCARPHTTMTDRAPPRTTTHDRPRTTTHDHALPRMTDHARTTAHGGSGTHPTPGGFRGLNCLARLALARERTPSNNKYTLLIMVLSKQTYYGSCFVASYYATIEKKLTHSLQKGPIKFQ